MQPQVERVRELLGPTRLDRLDGPLLETMLYEANLLWRIVSWANFRRRWAQGVSAGVEFRY